MIKLHRLFAFAIMTGCSAVVVESRSSETAFVVSMPGESWHESFKNVPLDNDFVLLTELRHAGHGSRISLFDGPLSEVGSLYAIALWQDRYLRSLRPGYKFPSQFRRDNVVAGGSSFTFEGVRYGERWLGKAIAFRNPLRPKSFLIAEVEAAPRHFDSAFRALEKVIADLEANAWLRRSDCGVNAKNWPRCRERR